MKLPIPDDWNGEDWRCVKIQWPDSPYWRAILTGLISTPSRGRLWDEDTGTIIDAQAIGRLIFDRNFPYTACDDEQPPCPECPPEDTETDTAARHMVSAALDSWEYDAMPCIDISGLLKIENGHLYARDSCCEWIDIGPVGTTEALPPTLWDDDPTPPTYYACAKADAIINAMLAVINGVYDAANDWNPLSWIGTVESYVSGYNLSNTVVASMLAQVPIAAAVGVSQSDITNATKVQTLRCQFVSVLQSDNSALTQQQYDALQGILSGVFGVVAGNMWLLAQAALGKGNLSNIAIAAATNADANCLCPNQNEDELDVPAGFTWHHQYDFRLDDYDWTLLSSPNSVYTAGVGWQTLAIERYFNAPQVRKTVEFLSGSADVRYIGMVLSWPFAGDGGGVSPQWVGDSGGIKWYDANFVGRSVIQVELNAAYMVLTAGDWPNFLKYQFTNAAVSGDFTLSKLIMVGTGDDPFPSDPPIPGYV